MRSLLALGFRTHWCAFYDEGTDACVLLAVAYNVHNNDEIRFGNAVHPDLAATKYAIDALCPRQYSRGRGHSHWALSRVQS